jgi:hypothetical protein
MGSDLCRSLLSFSEKKPLGPRGLFWLKVRNQLFASLYWRSSSLLVSPRLVSSHLISSLVVVCRCIWPTCLATTRSRMKSACALWTTTWPKFGPQCATHWGRARGGRRATTPGVFVCSRLCVVDFVELLLMFDNLWVCLCVLVCVSWISLNPSLFLIVCEFVGQHEKDSRYLHTHTNTRRRQTLSVAKVLVEALDHPEPEKVGFSDLQLSVLCVLSDTIAPAVYVQHPRASGWLLQRASTLRRIGW